MHILQLQILVSIHQFEEGKFSHLQFLHHRGILMRRISEYIDNALYPCFLFTELNVTLHAPLQLPVLLTHPSNASNPLFWIPFCIIACLSKFNYFVMLFLLLKQCLCFNLSGFISIGNLLFFLYRRLCLCMISLYLKSSVFWGSLTDWTDVSKPKIIIFIIYSSMSEEVATFTRL